MSKALKCCGVKQGLRNAEDAGEPCSNTYRSKTLTAGYSYYYGTCGQKWCIANTLELHGEERCLSLDRLAMKARECASPNEKVGAVKVYNDARKAVQAASKTLMIRMAAIGAAKSVVGEKRHFEDLYTRHADALVEPHQQPHQQQPHSTTSPFAVEIVDLKRDSTSTVEWRNRPRLQRQ